MKNCIALIIITLAVKINAQNVGIGTATPNDKLDVIGNVRATGLRVTDGNVIELGFGAVGKQTDNGKIGYNTFGEANTLSIVGGGILASGFDRKIKMWADAGTNFTGGASFAKSVGIGVLNPNYKLHLYEPSGGTGVNFQLANADAGNTVNDGLHIGLNSNGLAFGLAASIINKENSLLSFGTNNQPRMTIDETGKIGIGLLVPEAPLHIVSPSNGYLFRVQNTEAISNGRDIFAASPDGVNIYSNGAGNIGKDGPQPGTSLINTNNASNLGKWGYDNTGTEMEASEQTINHATPTRLDFGTPVFEHSNFGLANQFDVHLADADKDQFNIVADGVYLVDFQVNWFDPDFDIGGTGLRNGKILVRVNGITRREFKCDLNIREHCFIKCKAFDYVTVEAYHEHCFDPPPICITGISRKVTYARVTVMKF